MKPNQNTGDVLGVPSGIVVHGCNAQGVMGSGIAVQIKQKYPEVFEAYKRWQKERGLHLGDVVFCPPTPSRPFWLANAITQEFYGRDGRVYVDYDAVKTCFDKVSKLASTHGLSVHYPKIGAGLGGGDWDKIREIISSSLDGLEHSVWLLEEKPRPDPASKHHARKMT